MLDAVCHTKISRKNSILMITIFRIPFNRDSKTFASRFWRTMCFTGWLHLSSNISVFFGSTAYISDIFQYILCFHFSNVLWGNKNWNACSNACDLAAWDRASSWLALIEVSRRWLPPWTSTFCWNRTNTKLEMKSTMHFNHYLLIRHSKNEKI